MKLIVFLVQNQNLFFGIAIVAFLLRMYAESRGSRKLVYQLSWPILITSALLAVISLIALVVAHDPFSVLMVILWAWNTVSCWRTIKSARNAQ